MKRRDFLTASTGAAIASGFGLALVSPWARAADPAASGFSAKAFKALLNQYFRIYPGIHGVVVQLIAIDDISAHFKGGNHQFRLVFAGRASDSLPAGTYEVEHFTLGTFPLYLQPSPGSNANEVRYRAEFNLAG